MSTHAPSIDLHAPPAEREHDPVLDAILHAPLSAAPETDEMRAAFDVLMASIGSGRFIGPEEIAKTIATMRREAGE